MVYIKKLTIKELQTKFNRTAGAIRSRLKRLGINGNYVLNYDGTIKNELANKLKKYRRQISLDKHIPEFGIFNNKDLIFYLL